MSPLLALRGAGVSFGAVQALRAVNLRIDPGERVALVGSNGSGKSTLLRLLHGLIPCSAGEFASDGTQVQAMVFQHPHMLRASCLHNVALGLWLSGRRWGDACTQASAALERVGLAALARRNAKSLSGGQQQRLALARAWALAPDVLLLDEPTASLDPHAKREVEALLSAFAAQTTLVFSSHNLGQVKRLASRVVYLEQGAVLADLPVDDFFAPSYLQAHCPAAHVFTQGELP